MAEPTQAPAPTTEAQQSGEQSSEECADSTGNTIPDRRIGKRRIVAVNRRAPNVLGIVNGWINHLRIGRLNHDRVLPVLLLIRDTLLRRVCQTPVGARRSAELLDGIHQLGLLREEGIAECGGPLDVAR